MTREALTLRWPEVGQDARRIWGKLTEADLDLIDGQFDRFVKLLRERYGYSPLKAEDEVVRFLHWYSDSPGMGATQPASR